MKKAFADIAQQLANVPPHATGALIVDLGSLRRNYQRLRTAAPSAGTSAVLKADAYGIGAAKAAPALEMEGCKTFFVATLAEARALRSLIANSAGIALGPRFQFELTRPGISLYGGRAQSWGQNPMEPVVSLYGRIAQVAWAERGETVGYGASHTLNRRTRIATVCVGYADGL